MCLMYGIIMSLSFVFITACSADATSSKGPDKQSTNNQKAKAVNVHKENQPADNDNNALRSKRIDLIKQNRPSDSIVIDDEWINKSNEDVVYDKYFNHAVDVYGISKHRDIPVNIEFNNGLYALTIIKNTSLKTLRNIKIKGSISSLRIHKNVELVDMPNIDNVTTIDVLILHDNSQIANLDAIKNVRRIKKVSIARNRLLKDIKGLRGALISQTIQIGSNPSLTSLEGLQGASKKLNGLIIHDNPLITDLKPLKNVQEAEIVKINGEKLVIPEWVKKLIMKGKS